uniref:Uncharacterized protein n=1 Tax=Cucumis melo TaxID=3656 RepID=A0A9I9EH73_CUCME
MAKTFLTRQNEEVGYKSIPTVIPYRLRSLSCAIEEAWAPLSSSCLSSLPMLPNTPLLPTPTHSPLPLQCTPLTSQSFNNSFLSIFFQDSSGLIIYVAEERHLLQEMTNCLDTMQMSHLVLDILSRKHVEAAFLSHPKALKRTCSINYLLVLLYKIITYIFRFRFAWMTKNEMFNSQSIENYSTNIESSLQAIGIAYASEKLDDNGITGQVHTPQLMNQNPAANGNTTFSPFQLNLRQSSEANAAKWEDGLPVEDMMESKHELEFDQKEREPKEKTEKEGEQRVLRSQIQKRDGELRS